MDILRIVILYETPQRETFYFLLLLCSITFADSDMNKNLVYLGLRFVTFSPDVSTCCPSLRTDSSRALPLLGYPSSTSR